MQKNYTNALINEKSPYLLQHAHNPVNWYPWGDEVFTQAKAEDKPILLSIGYSTCHWCHVMERESFEDPNIANILNEKFFSIKVDREEQPDVDHIYMRALQAMGQQGGWPLNIFLTPEGIPITGGTYFPPQPLYNQPSFTQVLQAISGAWENDRQKLTDSAQAIHDFLKQNYESHENGNRRSDTGKDSTYVQVNWTHLQQSVNSIKESYDSLRGGFLHNGPNKFPPTLQLLFFISAYRKTKDEKLLEIVENTIDHIKRGGIYDQIGGGLARYSTDHDWLVPHFEKMLYDNALFAWLMVETYRVSKKERYRQWALDLFDYIERDMTSPEGSFYCAQDADSEGLEGKFYVWSFSELEAVLQRSNFSLVQRQELYRFWGVNEEGNFEGYNILHEPCPREQFLSSIEYSKQEWEDILKKARQILLAQRSQRVHPLRDDKIITAWNAYMISALAQAARAFTMPELGRRAQKAADFLWNNMRSPKGDLLRRFREGEAHFSANLSDYAAFGCACIDLYRFNFDVENMRRAKEISHSIIEKFAGSQGIFYDTSKENTNLIVRPRDNYDGVEPSGNSQTARLFYSLVQYGIDVKENQTHLESIIGSLSTSLQKNGSIHTFLLYVYSLLLDQPRQIAIVQAPSSQGDSNSCSERSPDYISGIENKSDIIEWINQNISGEVAVSQVKADELESQAQVIPLLGKLKLVEGKTSIYVCQDLSCQIPVHNLKDLQALLASIKLN